MVNIQNTHWLSLAKAERWETTKLKEGDYHDWICFYWWTFWRFLWGGYLSKKTFPLMPEGEAFDMGRDESGKPLFDPRIFDSLNFSKPRPYYRILRDHYPVFHDKLHNTFVTRYEDITECYFDDEGFNTIPKDLQGVLGNTQPSCQGWASKTKKLIRATLSW